MKVNSNLFKTSFNISVTPLGTRKIVSLQSILKSAIYEK